MSVSADRVTRPALVMLLLVGLIGLGRADERLVEVRGVPALSRGEAVARLGMEHQRDATFRLSGLGGHLTRLGMISFRVAPADGMEVGVDWAAQDLLRIRQRDPAFNSGILNTGASSTHDFGDPFLTTAYRFFRGRRLAAGAAITVQVPSASNESGLGNDQTNLLLRSLWGYQAGRLSLTANLGVGFFGSPTVLSSQNDKVLYGLEAGWRPFSPVEITAGVAGRFNNAAVGNEDLHHVRAGVRAAWGGVVWDVSGLVGLTENDPRIGIALGVSRSLRLFSENPSAR